jgi:DNA-dependent RNA polymerase auxiliary subunit epsilon
VNFRVRVHQQNKDAFDCQTRNSQSVNREKTDALYVKAIFEKNATYFSEKKNNTKNFNKQKMQTKFQQGKNNNFSKQHNSTHSCFFCYHQVPILFANFSYSPQSNKTSYSAVLPKLYSFSYSVVVFVYPPLSSVNRTILCYRHLSVQI